MVRVPALSVRFRRSYCRIASDQTSEFNQETPFTCADIPLNMRIAPTLLTPISADDLVGDWYITTYKAADYSKIMGYIADISRIES